VKRTLIRNLYLTILSSLILLISGSCFGSPATSPGTSGIPSPNGNTSASNGQKIYETATSASGEPITYTGGPGMMMQTRLACTNCHGPQGHGGTVTLMMQRFDVPNITWPVLISQTTDTPAYTEETVKRAITQGIDSAGGPLNYPMPRWQISPQDLNDLLAFIKTLR
jgi:cytochrome c oxidase subunit 2